MKRTPPKPKHKLTLVVGTSRYDDAKRMLPRGSLMPRTADVDMMMASAARATSATEKAACTKRYT